MKIDSTRLQYILRNVSNLTRDIRLSMPERDLAIEAILVAELYSMGPNPQGDAMFAPWFTLNIKPMAISLLSTVNEDCTIDIPRILGLTESAYRGVHQQLNSDSYETAVNLLCGKMSSVLPPAHCEVLLKLRLGNNDTVGPCHV